MSFRITTFCNLPEDGERLIQRKKNSKASFWQTWNKICLHAGRWQHTWTRTDDSTEGKWKIMFFSFDYVIKEMVNVAAVQPWSYASECIHNSMVAQLQRLPYTPYTYWEILTKKLCRKFCTQISSSQSEERTMVFTREKNDTSNQNRERCFFTCEKNDTSNQKPQRCVSFAPKFPPFIAACSSASHTFNEESFIQRVFLAKKVKNISEMEWNSFVCFTVDKENGREPEKQQRKGINRTRRKLLLCFLSELLCLSFIKA